VRSCPPKHHREPNLRMSLLARKLPLSSRHDNNFHSARPRARRHEHHASGKPSNLVLRARGRAVRSDSIWHCSGARHGPYPSGSCSLRLLRSRRERLHCASARVPPALIRMEPRVLLSRCLRVSKIEIAAPSAVSLAWGQRLFSLLLPVTFSISQADRGAL